MKKEFITKKSLRENQIKKEKEIIESFAKTFNSIKRIDENEINGLSQDNDLTDNLSVGDEVIFADPSSQETQAVAKYIDDYVSETSKSYYVLLTFNGTEYNGEPSVALLSSTGYIIYAAIPTRLFKKIGHNTGIANDTSEESSEIKSQLLRSSLMDLEGIIARFGKTFDSINSIDEVEIQWMDEPKGEEVPQVLDADATLRAVQTAVKSGAKMEVAIETGENEHKFMEVFKMPMINLVTFVEGGKTVIPKNPEFLETCEEILIDGVPLKDSNFLRYKDAPKPQPKPEVKPFDPSAYSDPNSIYYRGGD